MEEFVSKLGIDWRLIAGQAVNFFILFWLLKKFAYGPITRILKERKGKIEEGLFKAEEAGRKLSDVEEIAKGRMKKAESEALSVIRSAEERSKAKESEAFLKIREKEKSILAEAKMQSEKIRLETEEKVLEGAGDLIKKVLVKTVELDPKAVDEAMIGRAVNFVRSHKEE